MVLSFDMDFEEGIETIKKDVESIYPDYQIQIVPDLDL